MKKVKVKMNVMVNFIKIIFQNNAKLYYMDTDSFIIDIKTEDVYEYIADDVGKRFDA